MARGLAPAFRSWSVVVVGAAHSRGAGASLKRAVNRPLASVGPCL